MPEDICIEVALAYPQQQWLVELCLPVGSTVEQAIQRSQNQGLIPQDLPQPLLVGIWGRSCALNTELKQGDRVEIYRPLVADPKEARRRRARSNR